MRALAFVWMGAICVAANAASTTLNLIPAPIHCGIELPLQPRPPAVAAQRLPQSQAVQGQRDIAWAWLGSPSNRYAHAALGSNLHATTLHALLTNATGQSHEVTYQLPLDRVFEDRVPRLIDLDQDGNDEIVVVEADARHGASLVVFGVRSVSQATNTARPRPQEALVELARSPAIGQPMRWLNPVGAADFDGDGQIDLAAVITPHLDGVLTLYQFHPPQLVPYASASGFSNHRNGTLEQQLAVVVDQQGKRPSILIADLQYRTMNLLRWDAPGRWSKVTSSTILPAVLEYSQPIPGGGCLRLTDGSWWRATRHP